MWPLRKLGEVAEISIGRTPFRQNPDYWTDSLERPFCTIADMSDFLVHPRREGVTELAERDKKAKRVPAGSLMLSFKLTLGRVGVAAIDLFPNEAIAHISPDTREIRQEYLAYALRTVDFDSLANDAAKGKTLNKGSLAELEIVVPDLELQQAIVDRLDRVDNLARAAADFASTAARMRDSAIWAVLTDPANIDVLDQQLLARMSRNVGDAT